MYARSRSNIKNPTRSRSPASFALCRRYIRIGCDFLLDYSDDRGRRRRVSLDIYTWSCSLGCPVVACCTGALHRLGHHVHTLVHCWVSVLHRLACSIRTLVLRIGETRGTRRRGGRPPLGGAASRHWTTKLVCNVAPYALLATLTLGPGSSVRADQVPVPSTVGCVTAFGPNEETCVIPLAAGRSEIDLVVAWGPTAKLNVIGRLSDGREFASISCSVASGAPEGWQINCSEFGRSWADQGQEAYESSHWLNLSTFSMVVNTSGGAHLKASAKPGTGLMIGETRSVDREGDE